MQLSGRFHRLMGCGLQVDFRFEQTALIHMWQVVDD